MKKEHAEFLKNALDYCGEEVTLHEYSGRGMRGRKTFGIVFDNPTLIVPCLLDYIRENPRIKIPSLETIQSDNMAQQVIWY